MDRIRRAGRSASSSRSRLRRSGHPFARAATLLLVGLAIGACGSSAASLPASGSPAASASIETTVTPSVPGPTRSQFPSAIASLATSPAAATATIAATPTVQPLTLYIRSWTTLPSIGPVNYFHHVPLVISNGRLVTVAYAPNPTPFPLYTGPTRRAITSAGIARIVAEARADGLLGTVTTFTCPFTDDGGMEQGGQGPSYIEIVVNGVRHLLTASCPRHEAPTADSGAPVPGTWAAFERFRKLLAAPSAWLGSDIGPAVAYDPDSLAVLAETPAYTLETPPAAGALDWPLATTFASLGVAWDPGLRCAVVTGSNAAALLAAVKPALVDAWFRDSAGEYAHLVARAFLPGEPNPCQAQAP